MQSLHGIQILAPGRFPGQDVAGNEVPQGDGDMVGGMNFSRFAVRPEEFSRQPEP